jgi:hypothetical protein
MLAVQVTPEEKLEKRCQLASSQYCAMQMVYPEPDMVATQITSCSEKCAPGTKCALVASGGARQHSWEQRTDTQRMCRSLLPWTKVLHMVVHYYSTLVTRLRFGVVPAMQPELREGRGES